MTARHPSKANSTSFSSGNRAARKHGEYARLLDQGDVEIAAKVTSLEDELLACRSRLVFIIKARSEMEKTDGMFNSRRETPVG